MNVNQRMNAIFLTTLAIVGAGSLAVDRLPDAAARTQAQAQTAIRAALEAENSVGTPGHMAVIVVRGRRAPHGA